MRRLQPGTYRGTQGVEVALRFYRNADAANVEAVREGVATAIAQAMGLWERAVELDIEVLEPSNQWLGTTRPSRKGATALRLDRYLTTEVLTDLESKRGGADWKRLAERSAEVRILLRRLRYKLGDDFGSGEPLRRYAYWTTETTNAWARRGGHQLDYLVSGLSCWSAEMVDGNADPASSLHPGYWGEVDTELDPLRVLQVTTAHGTTASDVSSVLDHAGDQIAQLHPWPVWAGKETNRDDPLLPFIEGLDRLLDRPRHLSDVDVLLIHRGGGLNPSSTWGPSNVPEERKVNLMSRLSKVLSRGTEVIVALGHANISVIPVSTGNDRGLPIGLFEAATPTAGAAWLLQEHINPRLVDTGLVYGQPVL
ncbi:MAG: hypothetical protein J0I18_15915 [Actinobacteria bacterium]|nr:hypothetical protein [Actinomycetota bacterium]